MCNLNNCTVLPLVSCVLLDLPEGGKECSYTNSECIFCPVQGSFFRAQDKIDDFGSVSHVISIFLWVTTASIGIFGTFANILILVVLKRQSNGRAFDTMLKALAGFDLLCSVMAVITTTSLITYLQNWCRGRVTLILFDIGILTALFGRSGSSFMTLAITVERYLVVAFPTQTAHWFTPKKTRGVAFLIFLFSVSMAIPRWSSMYVGENYLGDGFPSLRNLNYLILATPLFHFWYVTSKGFFDQIDFWTPLPLLLIFNGLLFIQIKRYVARRAELTSKQKMDIRAARIFIPVVIVLFCCNIFPIVHYYLIAVEGGIQRESVLANQLSIAINAAANIFIYYYRGARARAVLAKYVPVVFSTTFDDSATDMTSQRKRGAKSADYSFMNKSNDSSSNI